MGELITPEGGGEEQVSSVKVSESQVILLLQTLSHSW